MIRSLGYAVADWIEENCVIPDGERMGDPYELTTEMLTFLRDFYEVDANGKFRYRRAQLVRPQKWGKGPFSSAIICAEAYGPVCFSHWGPDGQPVGKPWATPHIQITAVSEDQTANVWRALQPMIELGNLAGEIPDTGLTRINLPGGGLIEPVTASARSRLGQRITFAVQDETHSWLKSNGGVALADNQRRNLAGMGGRSMETTNAWDPAEGSVAQQTWESDAPDVLRDMIQPDARWSIRNKAERRRIFRKVYGDSWWVDLDRIDAEVVELIPRDAAQAERYFANRIVAAEDAFLAPAAWDQCAGPDAWPEAGTPVTLGLDGSLYDDHTGLVGCTLDGHLFVVGHWDPAAHGGEAPKFEVDEAVDRAFTTWDVRALYADPPYWQEDVSRWYGRHGDRVREWWTNRPTHMARALELFHTSVMTRAVTHDGNAALAAHVGNARRFKDRGHLAVRKKFPQSPDKIDLLVCAVLALEARNDVLAVPEPEVKRPGTLLVF